MSNKAKKKAIRPWPEKVKHRDTVSLAFGNVLEQLVDAEKQMGKADRSGVGLAEAQAAVEIAETALAAATVHFTFEQCSRRLYASLLSTHPPTNEQRDQFRAEAKELGLPQKVIDAGLRWNPDTFPKAIFDACLVEVEPETDIGALVERIVDPEGDYTETEVQVLLTACIRVNEAVTLR